MKLTYAILTILFALSCHSFDVDFSLSLNVDLSIDIGAAISENVNIGTGLAALLNAVATVSSDLVVNGTVTLGSGINSPLLSIADGATLTVNALVLNGGDIEIEGSGSLIVIGDAAFNSDSDISGELNVEGNVAVAADQVTSFTYLAVNGAVTLATDSAITISEWANFAANATLEAGAAIQCEGEVIFEDSVQGAGEIYVSGHAYFTASVENTIATYVELMATGKSTVTGTVIFAGEVASDVNATLTAEANAIITFGAETTLGQLYLAAGATVEIAAEAEATIESTVWLVSSSSIEVEGSLTISGNVTGDGAINFVSEAESTVESSVVDATVTVSGTAHLIAARASSTTTFSSDLVVSGSGRLSISSNTELTVQGDVSFAAETAYDVVISAEDSVNVLTVEGEATLSGALEIETSVEITAESEIAILYYGSRASGSTFSSVTVTSNKRALSDDEYEVDYQGDRAVIRASSGSTDEDSSLSLAIGSLLFMFSLF